MNVEVHGTPYPQMIIFNDLAPNYIASLKLNKT